MAEEFQRYEKIFKSSYKNFTILVIISLSLMILTMFIWPLITSIFVIFIVLVMFLYLISYFSSISKGKSVFKKKRVIFIVSILLVFSAIYDFYDFPMITNFEIYGPFVFFTVICIVYIVKISQNTTSFWALPYEQIPPAIAEIKNERDIAWYINRTVQNIGFVNLHELSDTMMLPYNYLAKKVSKWISDGIITADINEYDNQHGEITLEKKESDYNFNYSNDGVERDLNQLKSEMLMTDESIQKIHETFKSHIAKTTQLIESGKYDEATAELEQIKNDSKSYNMPDVTELAEKHIRQAQMFKKLAGIFKISSRLKIDDLCEYLACSRKEIFDICYDVGEKFGMKIDGDYISINNADSIDSMMSDLLQKSFDEWAGKEKTKKGKI